MFLTVKIENVLDRDVITPYIFLKKLGGVALSAFASCPYLALSTRFVFKRLGSMVHASSLLFLFIYYSILSYSFVFFLSLIF